MAEIWINDAGVARQVRSIYVNDAGVVRRILEIWVGDAGTARRVFLGDAVSIALSTANRVTNSPTTATATYSVRSDGFINGTNPNGTTSSAAWISPQVNMTNFEARATLLSGTLSSGTLGAWLSLSATRNWTLQGLAGNGLNSASFTLEIRRASDAIVVASATVSMSAESVV